MKSKKGPTTTIHEASHQAALHLLLHRHPKRWSAVTTAAAAFLPPGRVRTAALPKVLDEIEAKLQPWIRRA
jgi:hypothetical protein